MDLAWGSSLIAILVGFLVYCYLFRRARNREQQSFQNYHNWVKKKYRYLKDCPRCSASGILSDCMERGIICFYCNGYGLLLSDGQTLPKPKEVQD